MYRIESDVLRAEINPIGAELFSLYSKETGKEYLWQGDPAWWTGRAPILFPIVCSMKDSSYTYNGNTYTMPKHGFVRHAKFTVKPLTASKIIFEYNDNAETHKAYPFAFQFQVIFEMVGNTLSTMYRVENRDN